MTTEPGSNSGGPDRAAEVLKIAYLSPTGAIGGAEMVLLDVLGAIGKARPSWSRSVILMSSGPLVTEVEKLGATAIVLDMPGQVASVGDAGLGRWKGQGALNFLFRAPSLAIATLRYTTRLRKTLRELQPDILHTNGMKAHLLGSFTARRDFPIVWHLHDYLGFRALMARLLKLALRKEVTVAAISDSVAADARSTLGSLVPIERIYNAVDPARFHPGPGDGAALDNAAGLPVAPEGTIRVGLVATFARWKGHDVFLHAVAEIPAEIRCRFYIVGGPIYQSAGSQYTLEELKTLARELSIEQRVGMTGHRSDPAEAIRGLDVVVHASTRPEPFGRVIVEAMSCGRALVAVHSGGAAELFEDGREALASPAGDSKALAQRLIELIESPTLRERLGKAGRERVEQCFGVDRLTEEWPRLYTRVKN